MKNVHKFLGALLLAALITLISGLFPTPHVKGPIPVDVALWGTPLPWVTVVIPTRFKIIHWGSFVADLGFWAAICLVVAGVLVVAEGRNRRPDEKEVMEARRQNEIDINRINSHLSRVFDDASNQLLLLTNG